MTLDFKWWRVLYWLLFPYCDKTLWTSSSEKKEFIMACGSRGLEFSWGGHMGSRRQTWLQKQKSESSCPFPQHTAEKVNRKWRERFLILKPALSDGLPPARLYHLNLPKQLHRWNPSIETMQDVLHSNYRICRSILRNPSHSGPHLSAHKMC